ncbi:hypothetical protein [Arthrobacter bambusae]|nr:hypothetical protein [Arthrobacter bambusae]MDQ0029062.1 hypothetical protein [Arthrobacter bambusae]MDQ0098536.1 hypothetical protein [Arthrobacter bambusae]
MQANREGLREGRDDIGDLIRDNGDIAPRDNEPFSEHSVDVQP